jgi:DNA-binding MarR family transcriptional regulator
MRPNSEDVRQMVQALFTLTGGLERARRRIPGASTLSVLQIIAAHDKIRPSELAAELGLHQSTITRQIQSLEDNGQVALIADTHDRRSCTITLTEAGWNEVRRLTQIGLERFATFVADWDAEEVRTLTRLLIKLDESKATKASQERRRDGRRWQSKEADDEPDYRA